MSCPSPELYLKYIQEFNGVEIDPNTEKNMRFNVWNITPEDVHRLVNTNSVEGLPGKDESKPTLLKIENALTRILNSGQKADTFKEDIIGIDNDNVDQDSISKAIALHEVMEAVKGESDKARNNDVQMSQLSVDGILPVLPLSRLAASIGRKWMYKNQARYKSMEESPKTAAEIEQLYYTQGIAALELLEEKGYVNFHDDVTTIRDYTDSEAITQTFESKKITTTNAKSVSLNTSKLGISKYKVSSSGKLTDTLSQESSHFLNRTAADLSGTELGTIVDTLSVVRHVTQPSNITMPYTGKQDGSVDVAQSDPDGNVQSPSTQSARQKLFDNPLYVNNTVHDLFALIKEETDKTGESATKLLTDKFKNKPLMIKSLFGIKTSDDHSVDRQESVSGQNLSKTVPLDDIIETYNQLVNSEGNPEELHMIMKGGRNIRLYYDNSVLNAHASKQSRHMLTSGTQSVKVKSFDFNRLVYSIKETLDDKELTYKEIVEGGNANLDAALQDFKSYENAKTLQRKIVALSNLPERFQGVDYAALLVTLKGVQDIRDNTGDTLQTELMDSADATAQGGTLTFQQALGTNANVETFMESIGIITDANGNLVLDENKIDDVYALMSDATSRFINKKDSLVMSPDIGQGNVRELLQTTLNLLFGGTKEGERAFAKDPTMVFIYGQGPKGAVKSMADTLAKRIIDNLADENIRDYLGDLMDSPSLKNADSKDLKDISGLYSNIKSALITKGVPKQLYEIMQAEIYEAYLKDFRKDGADIYNLATQVKDNHRMKVLPFGAVLDGIGIDQVKTYGMPLTKIVEVSSPLTGDSDLAKEGGHTVLTRKQELFQSIMDVSVIHGIDSGLMYHAINEVLGDSGAIVVHDQIIGTTETVRLVEEAYVRLNKRLLGEYDTHQQVLNSIEFYDPALAKSDKFTKLKAKIDARVAAKAKIANSERMNMKTNALIGNSIKAREFAGADANTEVETATVPNAEPATANPSNSAMKDAFDNAAPNTTTTASEPETATESLTDVETILEQYKEESPIIKSFLEGSNSSNVRIGEEFEFDTETDTVVISENSTDRKTRIELIEHEIVHSFTAGVVIDWVKRFANKTSGTSTQLDLNMAYIDKTMNHVLRKTFSNKTQERMDYIDINSSQETMLSEFIAIMNSEPDVAAEVYSSLNNTSKNKLAKVLEFVKNKVITIINNVTYADFKIGDPNAEKLFSAINGVIVSGKSKREEDINFITDMQKQFETVLFSGKNRQTTSAADMQDKASLRYLNAAVSSMLNSKIERKGKRLLNTLDKNMKRLFPLYSDAADKLSGIYEGSEALQGLVQTITGEGTNKVNKADLLADSALLEGQQISSIAFQKSEFKKALTGVSKDEVSTIGRFVTQLPLHDYFVFASDITTSSQIDAEVTRLETEIKKVSKSAIRDVDHLIERNVERTVETEAGTKEGGKLYNLASTYAMSDSATFSVDIRKLLALKSIQKIGNKEFESFLAKTDLVNLVKDNSIANRVTMLGVEGTEGLRDSMLPEYYKESHQTKAIELKDLRSYEIGEETGWKVLRNPTKDNLGIVYKKLIDSTELRGAYTDIKLSSTDVDVTSASQINYSNVVKAESNKFKVVLSPAEKETLGIETDFVNTLVRGAAHSMAIKDSQIIRNNIVMSENRFLATNDTDLGKLKEVVDSDNMDNPWFVKLDDGKAYNTLDKSIRARYKPVGGRISDVKGTSGVKFSDQITLVRKDMSHLLIGGFSKSLIDNHHMKWAMRIVKDLTAGSKIGMVVVNPAKWAIDVMSNVAYLSVAGASPLFIGKNFLEISKDYDKYQNITNEIIQLKVRLVGTKDNQAIKDRITALKTQIDNTSVGNLGNKGFINSLGSDLVAKNSDASSGFQADVQTALEYMLTDRKGNKNVVAHFIKTLNKIGFQGEDFLSHIGGIVGKSGYGKGAQQQLDMVTDRIKELKTDEDVVGYVSQFTTSPNSEIVRLGSSVTDRIDVFAKETLYRHAIQNEKMTPSQARIHVLDSFPDYKENLPMAVKQLSDVGILMFPSYWLRIQKAIYRMVKDKPVNLSTEMVIQEYVTGNMNTIFSANVLNMSTRYGGIAHMPLESVGVGSVVPENVFKGVFY